MKKTMIVLIFILIVLLFSGCNAIYEDQSNDNKKEVELSPLHRDLKLVPDFPKHEPVKVINLRSDENYHIALIYEDVTIEDIRLLAGTMVAAGAIEQNKFYKGDDVLVDYKMGILMITIDYYDDRGEMLMHIREYY